MCSVPCLTDLGLTSLTLQIEPRAETSGNWSSTHLDLYLVRVDVCMHLMQLLHILEVHLLFATPDSIVISFLWLPPQLLPYQAYQRLDTATWLQVIQVKNMRLVLSGSFSGTLGLLAVPNRLETLEMPPCQLFPHELILINCIIQQPIPRQSWTGTVMAHAPVMTHAPVRPMLL